MNTMNNLKESWFNECCFVHSKDHKPTWKLPHGLTINKIMKNKEKIMNSKELWQDVFVRHGFNDMHPEQAKIYNPSMYEHCLGNMISIINFQIIGAK